MDIGVLGLGIMGENLILNLLDKEYSVSIFNRTTSKTKVFINENKEKKVLGSETLSNFVESLNKPRKIVLMIQSGDAVDQLLDSLKVLLSKEDVVIDGGNSFYLDTVKRSEKFKNCFEYLGCGISGGEEGARHGPSLMIGGSYEGWLKVKEIFEKISAKADNLPCCAYLGEDGAGHFVKMVHNGIEYCEMQLITEVYLFLHDLKYSNQEISTFFKNLKKKNYGYLIEIVEKILGREDNIIDKIMDKSSQKGTGLQCAISALNLGCVNSILSEAVCSRIISNNKEKRKSLSEIYETTKIPAKFEFEKLEDIFLLAKAVSYIQGYSLLNVAIKKFNWSMNLNEVSQIWKNGCILKGDFLTNISEIIKDLPFEKSLEFKKFYDSGYEKFKTFLKMGVDNETPLPCFSSVFNYLNDIKRECGGGNLIQAMRDYFGGHTLQIEGDPEFLHFNWSDK